MLSFELLDSRTNSSHSEHGRQYLRIGPRDPGSEYRFGLATAPVAMEVISIRPATTSEESQIIFHAVGSSDSLLPENTSAVVGLEPIPDPEMLVTDEFWQ